MTLLNTVIEDARKIKPGDKKPNNTTLLSAAATNDIPKVKVDVNKEITNTLISEAVGEGTTGMEFVNDVMHNQSDFFKKPIKFVIKHYYAGPKRKDLKTFISRQPKELVRAAQNIATKWQRGIAKGSLHFMTPKESEKPFGWIKKEGGYIPLVRIGNHIGFVTAREYHILKNRGKLPVGLEGRIIKR